MLLQLTRKPLSRSIRQSRLCQHLFRRQFVSHVANKGAAGRLIRIQAKADQDTCRAFSSSQSFRFIARVPSTNSGSGSMWSASTPGLLLVLVSSGAIVWYNSKRQNAHFHVEPALADTSSSNTKGDKEIAKYDKAAVKKSWMQSAFFTVCTFVKGTWLNICQLFSSDGMVLESILTVIRTGQLLVYFSPLIITYPICWFGTKRPERENARSGALWWYCFVRAQMSRAGPTFVKLAQWAASRTDLFSRQFCLEIGKLHTNNDKHSTEHTMRMIMGSFECDDIDDVFDLLNREPIGVGAVAQVHRARFSDSFISHLSNSDDSDLKSVAEYLSSYPDVVVKVLHPGVERYIKRDLRIMRWGATILNVLPGISWLSLPEEVTVFGEMMETQLDLKHEANNLNTFIANFVHRPGINFPKPIGVLSSKNVLIESYENGIPLRALLDINGHSVYDKDLGTKGLDAFLNMLIYDNFIHTDLHPGNILFNLSPPYISTPLDRFIEEFYDKSPFTYRKRGNQIAHTGPNMPSSSQAHDHIRSIMESAEKHSEISHEEMSKRILEYLDYLYTSGYTAELVILDCGLATSLDDTNRRNFIDLFEAVCTFDGELAGRLMIDRCQTPDLVINSDVFILRIQEVINKVRKLSLQLSKLTFSDVFAPVMSAVRTHHVKLEPDFINIIVAMFILEGIGRRLNPDSDILKSSLPILRRLLKDDAKHEIRHIKSPLSTRDSSHPRVTKVSSWHIYALWVYLEVREYFDTIKNWGYDDYEYFGQFSPFVSGNSSIS